jgi:transposase
MGTSNYSDEFKRDAVQQIRVRRYPVREVSQRLGVSSHSLCKWMKFFAEPAPKVSGVDHEAGNRRLKRELARVTEERDWPAAASSATTSNWNSTSANWQRTASAFCRSRRRWAMTRCM